MHTCRLYPKASTMLNSLVPDFEYFLVMLEHTKHTPPQAAYHNLEIQWLLKTGTLSGVSLTEFNPQYDSLKP